MKQNRWARRFLPGCVGVRQPGAHHGVALPERVDLLALKTPVDPPGLRQQAPGLALAAQVGGQGVDTRAGRPV